MEKNKMTYQSPEVDAIDICAENVICASGDNVTVADPWSGNVEQEW